jgi:hypothetical protein
MTPTLGQTFIITTQNICGVLNIFGQRFWGLLGKDKISSRNFEDLFMIYTIFLQFFCNND